MSEPRSGFTIHQNVANFERSHQTCIARSAAGRPCASPSSPNPNSPRASTARGQFPPHSIAQNSNRPTRKKIRPVTASCLHSACTTCTSRQLTSRSVVVQAVGAMAPAVAPAAVVGSACCGRLLQQMGSGGANSATCNAIGLSDTCCLTQRPNLTVRSCAGFRRRSLWRRASSTPLSLTRESLGLS